MNTPMHRSTPTRPKKESPWEVARFALLWIVALVCIRTFLVEPFTIPSASMIPTLQINDYVIVTKFDYGYSRYSIPFAPHLFNGRVFGSKPHRGDVAVFRFTKDPSINYIKRVVGLPGDHIQMQNGELYINGVLVPRQSKGAYAALDERRIQERGIRYIETLPASRNGSAVSHQILKQFDTGERNNTEDYVVPAGYFFAMGDNRDNSGDSRFQGDDPNDLGYVPMENLVGKARFVFFSYDSAYPFWQFWHWPTEIRWGHLFATMH